MTAATRRRCRIAPFPGFQNRDVELNVHRNGRVRRPMLMDQFPTPVRRNLRRLSWRLTAGLFLDTWPRWTAASLFFSGFVVLVCRVFVPAAAGFLPWLWLTPVLAVVPVVVTCIRQRYQPEQLIAVADWLGGGSGTLLTMFERGDRASIASAHVSRAASFRFPRVHPWRALGPLVAAMAFAAAAWWLPQRSFSADSTAELADEIAADLNDTLVQLKQQQFLTPEEEQRLEEQIETIRQGAQKRVDSSSWEAADAVRDQMRSGVSQKFEAVNWAQHSLARYAAAAGSGASESAVSAANAELTKALENLAQKGMLAGAPPGLQRLLANGKLPTDPAEMRELAAALSEYLAEGKGRFGQLAGMGREFGRFDPAEFPLESGTAQDVDARPGRGGIDRGRADAELTWGQETLPHDRFKSQPLPPGAARSPDDWTPVVTLPGAPMESPTSSATAAARQYAAGVGQTAWRRSLTPRHQSVVRKYFEK